MTESAHNPLLCLVVCGAEVAEDAGELITAAQDDGWEVAVVATPRGAGFLDAAAVGAATGHPLRSGWHEAAELPPLPAPDAVAVAPATFNTINKWAAGTADSLALSTLCEAYGTGVPTAALPYLNSALAAHPAYTRSLAALHDMGVLFGSYAPHDPQTAEDLNRFRWTEALELLAPQVHRAS